MLNKNKFHPYKLILATVVTIVLLYWIIKTDYPFQKGGVENELYFEIAFLGVFVSILVSFILTVEHLLERIVIGIITGGISLFIATLFVMNLVDSLYDGKTWLLWETYHRIFGNSLYYGTLLGNIIFLSRIYLAIRKGYGNKSTH
jgi:hypothetical protein